MQWVLSDLCQRSILPVALRVAGRGARAWVRPAMRINSFKSRAMNCGPLSEMIRGLACGYFSKPLWRKTRRRPRLWPRTAPSKRLRASNRRATSKGRRKSRNVDIRSMTSSRVSWATQRPLGSPQALFFVRTNSSTTSESTGFVSELGLQRGDPKPGHASRRCSRRIATFCCGVKCLRVFSKGILSDAPRGPAFPIPSEALHMRPTSGSLILQSRNPPIDKG